MNGPLTLDLAHEKNRAKTPLFLLYTLTCFQGLSVFERVFKILKKKYNN